MKRDFWLGAFSASGVIAAGFTLRRAWRHSAANRQRITVPGLTDVSLEQVIKGYRLWLGVCSPSHLAPFRQRLRKPVKQPERRRRSSRFSGNYVSIQHRSKM